MGGIFLLLSYLFLPSSFVFIDFERLAPLFFVEYIAMMGLFIFLAHNISKGLQALAAGRKKLAKKMK